MFHDRSKWAARIGLSVAALLLAIVAVNVVRSQPSGKIPNLLFAIPTGTVTTPWGTGTDYLGLFRDSAFPYVSRQPFVVLSKDASAAARSGGPTPGALPLPAGARIGR